jgi:plastocyanin
MIRPLITILSILSFSGSGSGTGPGADTGDIRGRIHIIRTDSGDLLGRQFIANRYQSRHFQPEESVRSTGAPRYTLPEKAVIYLVPEAQSSPVTHTGSGRRVVLDQRNLMFYPQVLAIERGTTVFFPNNDEVFHNVFSYSSPKQFDLGRYPKGQFRSVRFNEPGIVRLYCDIHAHMNAVIIVLEYPFFASPNDSGEYTIPNVPAGSYTAHFWYGRNLIDTRSIQIETNKIHILDFTY